MSEILFHYRKIDPTTWVYLSSLLTISLFFKFTRFWSVRNLDLALLILLAPGLLMVNQSREERPPAASATALQAGKSPDARPSDVTNSESTANVATGGQPGGNSEIGAEG